MRGPANVDAVQLHAAKLDAVAGASAGVIVAAVANHYWVLDTIDASYDGGSVVESALSILFGGQLLWQISVSSVDSPFQVRFPRGFYTGVLNEELIVSLAAGSGGTVAKVSCTYR